MKKSQESLDNTQSDVMLGKTNGLFPPLCSAYSVFTLVLAGELLALALVLVQSSFVTFSWVQLGYVSLVIQWIILLSALVLCQLSRVLSHLSFVLGGCLAYITVLLISLCVLGSSWWLMGDDPRGLELLKNMLLAAIFSGIFLRYLFLQQQLRQQQQAELQSQIQVLHARIRPHFLFNAMNAVASLIPSDPELAERVVEDLSEVFRASLKESSLVLLDEEIELCRHYADIEKVRLGERLQITWHCEHENCSMRVPSLILQPLIENAICHGIQRLPEGGEVIISTKLNEQQLIIKVINPVPLRVNENADKQTNKGSADNFPEIKNNHMALNNIRHRLQVHYGQQASINIKQFDRSGMGFYEVELLFDRVSER